MFAGSGQNTAVRFEKCCGVPVNRGLQLAYIFACNGGAKAAEWREHLFPAEVVAYDRVSTVWDHAFWFALTGPARLKEWQHPN